MTPDPVHAVLRANRAALTDRRKPMPITDTAIASCGEHSHLAHIIARAIAGRP